MQPACTKRRGCQWIELRRFLQTFCQPKKEKRFRSASRHPSRFHGDDGMQPAVVGYVTASRPCLQKPHRTVLQCRSHSSVNMLRPSLSSEASTAAGRTSTWPTWHASLRVPDTMSTSSRGGTIRCCRRSCTGKRTCGSFMSTPALRGSSRRKNCCRTWTSSARRSLRFSVASRGPTMSYTPISSCRALRHSTCAASSTFRW